MRLCGAFGQGGNGQRQLPGGNQGFCMGVPGGAYFNQQPAGAQILIEPGCAQLQRAHQPGGLVLQLGVKLQRNRQVLLILFVVGSQHNHQLGRGFPIHLGQGSELTGTVVGGIPVQIQHQLGADIMFAFDELTTLMNTRHYQEKSVERTHRWAARCLEEHQRQTDLRSHRPLQSLWGVVQGAQYEDLRRQAARGLVELSEQAESEGRRGFGGFGIGGALEKENLGTIVDWVCQELPEDKPRHLLGISEPDDLFTAIAAGADTFDCVAPTRLGRRGGVYTLDGRMNLAAARFKRDFSPIDAETGGYVSENYSRAYIHHLLKAKEFLAGTLCTLHNLHFMVGLVDQIRASIDEGRFAEFREQFLSRYYGDTWLDHI